jgi:hypothetical protein
VDAGCNWTGLVNTLQVAAIYDQTIQVWQDSFLTIEQKLAWPDAFAAKEVNQVVVYCANADAGCNWTGPVNTLQVHLQQCKSRLEICPNGCSEKIANSQVDKHISEECPYRKVVCEHCNRQITFIRKEVS